MSTRSRASACVLVVLLLLGCDAGGEVEEPIMGSCPPAPLRLSKNMLRCEFDDFCVYGTPRSLGDHYQDECNALGCRCQNGGLYCTNHLVGCNRKAHACPIGIVEGDACQPVADSWDGRSNGECLFGSDAAGETPTHACACDQPGPIWRCVPVGVEKEPW